MSAFVELQQKEFAAAEKGFTAVKHQREVGTGYFDEVTQVVTAGKASTTALHGSTEDEQFFDDSEEGKARGRVRKSAGRPEIRGSAATPRRRRSRAPSSPASTGTTGCSARPRRARRRLFERADWAGAARPRARAHPDVRPARRRRRCDGVLDALSGGRARRVAVAGDQARLHPAAARAPAARVRRDLLQLGRLPGAAPALLPQRVHLLAPGGRHRAPGGRRAGLSLLLPAQGRACAARSRRSCAASASPIPGRTCSRDLRSVLRALRAPFPAARRARVPSLQIQVLGSLFFRNKARLRRRADRERQRELPFAVPILQNERGELYLDALLARRGPAAGPVLLRARLLLRRHGGAGGVRLVPAPADAEQAARRDVHGGGPRQAGQDALLPRPVLPPEALVRQFRRRAGHQGHGDAGLHPALVPLRVQGDPRPLRAAQGHRPRRR